MNGQLEVSLSFHSIVQLDQVLSEVSDRTSFIARSLLVLSEPSAGLP